LPLNYRLYNSIKLKKILEVIYGGYRGSRLIYRRGVVANREGQHKRPSFTATPFL